MTNVRRAAALTAATLASAATLLAGGPANAACQPLLDPDFCEGVTHLDPLPDRCYYYPDTHTIRCYWDA